MCRRAEIETKVLSNIRLEDHGYETLCHVWCGSHSGTGRGGGYPRMSLDGQTVAVHIVIFTNVHGFVPGKKQIDHKCNNHMCVNPDHLQMVTHKKNQKLRDQRAKEKVNDKKTQIACISAEHGQLSCDDTSFHDRLRNCFPEFERFSEDEEAYVQATHDGRYLPDHTFWQTSSDVLSGSSHSAGEG